MSDLPEIAAQWGANGPVRLIAERENAVYKILRDGTPMALRLHRAGYQSEAAILSELRWMQRLEEAGFACPKHWRKRMDHYWRGWQMGALSL